MHTKRDGNTPKYVFIEVQCFFLEHKMHIYDQVNVTYNLNIMYCYGSPGRDGIEIDVTILVEITRDIYSEFICIT